MTAAAAAPAEGSFAKVRSETRGPSSPVLLVRKVLCRCSRSPDFPATVAALSQQRPGGGAPLPGAAGEGALRALPKTPAREPQALAPGGRREDGNEGEARGADSAAVLPARPPRRVRARRPRLAALLPPTEATHSRPLVPLSFRVAAGGCLDPVGTSPGHPHGTAFAGAEPEPRIPEEHSCHNNLLGSFFRHPCVNRTGHLCVMPSHGGLLASSKALTVLFTIFLCACFPLSVC